MYNAFSKKTEYKDILKNKIIIYYPIFFFYKITQEKHLMLEPAL